MSSPIKRPLNRGTALLLAVVALVLSWLGFDLTESDLGASAPTEARTAQEAAPGSSGRNDVDVVSQAFKSRTSGLMVEVLGRVERVLPDDNEGSRHQRFLIELSNGHTLLIAHNIDLAPRVPLDEGDEVTIHGQYEWNDRGGVVHWTHHDPQGRHEGGWIQHAGKRFE